MCSQASACEPSDSIGIESTVSSINDKRHNAMTRQFKNGSTSYMFFSKSEADMLHILGILTGVDGSFVDPGFNWEGYEITAVDSIIQWYTRNRHLLEEDSLKKWINWQQEYFDFLRSRECNDAITSAMFENWNDSIKDEGLRKMFLDNDGTWKMDFIDRDWRDLPETSKNALKKLMEQIPYSEFIRNNQKLDSLESRYYGLWGIYKE